MQGRRQGIEREEEGRWGARAHAIDGRCTSITLHLTFSHRHLTPLLPFGFSLELHVAASSICADVRCSINDAGGVRPAVPFAEGADGMGSKEIGGMLLLCLSRVQRSEYW